MDATLRYITEREVARLFNGLSDTEIIKMTYEMLNKVFVGDSDYFKADEMETFDRLKELFLDDVDEGTYRNFEDREHATDLLDCNLFTQRDVCFNMYLLYHQVPS